MDSIEIAKKIATEVHEGRIRRDGKPYITHPEAVAKSLQGQNSNVIAAAWLHDVFEDSAKFTSDYLREAGIPDCAIDAVIALTKWDGMSYAEYIYCVRADEIAKIVKIADICHNLSDNPTEEQKEKYLKALLFLAN
jgi:(p)ppGpp synthase/HD superfamily hydrolase